jgi:hypothetical protein
MKYVHPEILAESIAAEVPVELGALEEPDRELVELPVALAGLAVELVGRDTLVPLMTKLFPTVLSVEHDDDEGAG